MIRRIPERTMEFHISLKSRKKYDFSKTLFSITGNVVLADFMAAHELAEKVNEIKISEQSEDETVQASEINAMGLIDEIFHYIFREYRNSKNLNIFTLALKNMSGKFSQEKVDDTLLSFIELFPGSEVIEGKITEKDYLDGENNGVSNRELILEEMILLWFANINPAFRKFNEFFEDKELKEKTEYKKIIRFMQNLFKNEPGFGADSNTEESLFDFLMKPILAAPHSLQDQLNFMKDNWGIILEDFIIRLLSSMDFIKEENKPVFYGPGPTEVLEFENESEQFTPDRDWMPQVILLAKSTLVWLDQLSKKYEIEIKNLDNIPEEEIRKIASQGFNALWLIGLWERSRASQKIKQICGNPEAEASAYSLYDYDIAESIGGWEALIKFKDTCLKYGIRLASDMVPNHTGIESDWMKNHPDRFLQLPYSPFPGYSFNRTNLSNDPDYSVYIDDHYYDKTDAAVVFKRVDHHSGEERFIYHGNDGTTMPWNDTAQIDFLNKEARDAVIEKIYHVASVFPIIRFDAAMTLAKKHIQRLWFPEPGSGGDIASRAGRGLTKSEFNNLLPDEFWRDVVDKIAADMPDTLLLAEAFWMMEGYFVRTLGMHRVYNSAFMNMLKKEENNKFKQSIKNTQEFDPDILKRYVNFMNNPDEDTAVEQFGDSDKYFGVCTLMITLPGLPMFGHGQIQGFKEKYGMEYSKAYWEEEENAGLLSRHETEIFPLMKMRSRFSEAHNFRLFDLWTGSGSINENVFAYTNEEQGQISLVLYNNSNDTAEGWINHSSHYAIKSGNNEKILKTQSLSDAFHCSPNNKSYCLMKDFISGLWFIRSSKDLSENGFYVSLKSYEKHIFNEIITVQDQLGLYKQLCSKLNGSGTEDYEREIRRITMEPIREEIDFLYKQMLLHWEDFDSDLLRNQFRKTLKTLSKFYPAMEKNTEELLEWINNEIILYMKDKGQSHLFPEWEEYSAWLIFVSLGRAFNWNKCYLKAYSLLNEWLLDDLYKKWTGSSESRYNRFALIVLFQNWYEEKETDFYRLWIEKIFSHPMVKKVTGLNKFNNILWLNENKVSEFFDLLEEILEFNGPDKKTAVYAAKTLLLWRKTLKTSEFKLTNFLNSLPGENKEKMS